MYPLTYRSCVGRRATRFVDHLVRSASNKTSRSRANANHPSPHPTSPAAPAAPENQIPSSPATQASSDTSSRNPRIASSWNNVAIPTREEILKRPRRIVPGHDRGSLYKPDLSYLTKGSSTSFASRLAAEAPPIKPSAAANPATVPSSPPSRLTKVDKQEIKERERRIAEATAQRRAERLAREDAQKAKAMAIPKKPRQKLQLASRRADAYAGIDTAMQQVQRRGTQPNQHGQQPSRRGPASRGAQTERKGSNARHDARPPRISAVPKMRTMHPVGSPSNEDITLEIIEQGGDDKAPAEFRTPDVPLTNLDDVFGPSHEKRLEDATRVESNSTEARVQWLREVSGGDYSRFAPQTGADYVTPHRELGPLKHARLVLAKRRDVSVGARQDALAIITAVGDANNKAVQRA